MNNTQKQSILGCLVPVGSVYENKKHKGLSHFLEHLISLSLKKKEIQEKLTRFNIYFDAHTYEYYTYYKFYCLKKFEKEALKIMKDLILNPEFSQKDISIQKSVILEEINNRKDLYYKIWDDIKKTVLKDENVSDPIIGYPENIKNFNLNIIRNWYKNFYNKAIFVKWENAKLIFLNDIQKISIQPQPVSKINLENKKFIFKKQPAPAFALALILKDNFDFKERLALDIFYRIMCGAEASLLYQKLIMSGLAYNLYCFPANYNGASLIVFGAYSSQPQKISQKIQKIIQNFPKLFSKKLFAIFKESYLNSFLTQIANGNIIDFVFYEFSTFGKYHSLNKTLDYLKSINQEDINKIYHKIIKNSHWKFFYYN
ncbi:MAG: M16 family metallopeptidase [Minisyncoccia bacterium]